jgi:hypothetical protein
MNKLAALIRGPKPIERPPGTPRHITIVDLGPNDCRWIMNDDTSRAEYCGLPCCEGSPVYCADHHQRAYVRSAPRNTFRHYR